MQKLSAHDTCSGLEILTSLLEVMTKKEKETCIFTVVGSEKKSKDIWVFKLSFRQVFYLFCVKSISLILKTSEIMFSSIIK